MCLLGLYFRDHRDFPIAMFINREEERGRPTESPAWHEPIDGKCRWFGGKDLRADGTWLGINERGIVVAITNRAKTSPTLNKRSRGLLCRDLLELDSIDVILTYAKSEIDTNRYDGCNLLMVSSAQGFVFEAGDELKVCKLEPGIHALSNGSLDDQQDVRIRNVRTSLKTMRENDVLSNSAIKAICSGHESIGRNSACRDGENWGTVSSTILRIPAESSDANYFYSDGPPCRTAYGDYSKEIQKIRY